MDKDRLAKCIGNLVLQILEAEQERDELKRQVAGLLQQLDELQKTQ